MSTASGIPDYRDDSGAWKHKPPMRFQQFTESQLARQRYWARSLVGYTKVSTAAPNASHRAFAELERLGYVTLLVTQNVDGLHQRAGSQRVIDLHGRLDTVECLNCHREFERSRFQQQLSELNPGFFTGAFRSAPDGDAELGDTDYSRFLVPPCEHCGGVLKPGVVFFGEPVPVSRVRAGLGALERSSALLIAGSSLMVFSGFRFARAAHALGLPIYIVNRGKTRADAMATLKLEATLGEALPLLASVLGPR